MKEYLFVYGTLLPGKAPDHLREIVSRLKSVGRGSMRGRLYDLGRFPGVVDEAGSESRVVGHVFELPDDEGILARLDEYEGYSVRDEQGSLFVRVRATVLLAAGSEMSCWVYLYNREPGDAALIPGGEWRR